MALLVIASVVALLACLHWVGVPEFIRNPVVAGLKERGINLAFRRMRWRIGEGLIAEDVGLQRQGAGAGESISARELRLVVDHQHWWRGGFEVRSLRLRNGEVVVPVTSTNGQPFEFRVSSVDATVVFAGTNQWELQDFSALCHGGEFHARGKVLHPGLLMQKRKSQGGDAWKQNLSRFGRELEKWKFDRPPRLDVTFQADAQDPLRTRVDAVLETDGATGRGSVITGIRFSARADGLAPTNGLIPVRAVLEATSGLARNWKIEGFRAELVFDQPPTQVVPDLIRWRIESREVDGPWVRMNSFSAGGTSKVLSASTNPEISTQLQLQVGRLFRTNAEADFIRLKADVGHTFRSWNEAVLEGAFASAKAPGLELGTVDLRASIQPAVANPALTNDLGFWSAAMKWKGEAGISTSGGGWSSLARPMPLVFGKSKGRVRWRDGRLGLEELRTEVPSGDVQLSGDLDIVSRKANATARTTLDPHAISPWLTPSAQKWLTQYGWASNGPPHIEADLGLRFGPWNRPQAWRQDVQPTIVLAGFFSGTNLTFRSVPADSASGHFAYTNRNWTLPDLVVKRPEGDLQIRYRGNEVSHAYRFDFRSQIQPGSLVPLLEEEKQRQAVSEWISDFPPIVEGTVSGVWRERDSITGSLGIVGTNLVFRGVAVDRFSTRLEYTNRFLRFLTPVCESAEGYIRAEAVEYDNPRQRLNVVRAETTIPLKTITKVIGPKTERVMSPYQFEAPLHVTLHGVLPTRGQDGWDAMFGFKVSGFHWQRIQTQAADGRILVTDRSLVITNLASRMHQGRVDGYLKFDWRDPQATELSADLDLKDLDLKGFIRDVFLTTNRLEGRVSGRLNLDSAIAGRTNSWRGHGQLSLKDGYLWELPLFGAFSTVLDGIVPGIGQSQFSSGQGRFILTNGVIRTGDLELRSPAVRLGMGGTVSLKGELDARLQAELLRNTPLIGPLLSLALAPMTKLFEYKAEGTLSRPKLEPVYVPKLLLVPLHPIQSVKDLFGGTNTVPVLPERKP